MNQFNDNKAGMSGLDKKKIQQVISENTSANYSQFSNKKQKRIDSRVAEIKATLKKLWPGELNRSDKEMDEWAARLEAHRDLTRHCVHIDMDMFFAAVEMRDEPSLRSVPMAVGTSAMLSTSNYLARRFGVRAAMPGFIAKKLCPELKIVHGNYGRYGDESKVFSAIFAEYDPDMSMGSLDEAYLDITEYVNQRSEEKTLLRLRYGGECICRLPLIAKEEISDDLLTMTETCKKCSKERTIYEDTVTFGTSRLEIVNEIRMRVEQATGLTCSAGIAPNFMLAKICSDINKPNGVYEMENSREAVMTFLKDLPIRKVAGIGSVSEAHLHACDIKTVGDLLARKAVFPYVFTPLMQESMLRVALGLPGRPSASDPRRKSISVERTFNPTDDDGELTEMLEQICGLLAEDCKHNGITGGATVTVKIKLATFDVLTRQQSPGKLVATKDDIFAVASEILKAELGQKMRLLGVRLSVLQFESGPSKQPSLKEAWKQAEAKKRHSDAASPKKSKRTKSAKKKTDCGEDGSSAHCSTSAETSQEADEREEDCEEDDDCEALSEPSPHEERVSCPICMRSLPNNDRYVNNHVDECLNASALKVAVREENGRTPTTTSKSKATASESKEKKGKGAKSQQKQTAIRPITNFFNKKVV